MSSQPYRRPTPYNISTMDPTDEMLRLKRNKMEKNRDQQYRKALTDLRTNLPSACQHGRVTEVDTIKEATEYIHLLIELIGIEKRVVEQSEREKEIEDIVDDQNLGQRAYHSSERPTESVRNTNNHVSMVPQTQHIYLAPNGTAQCVHPTEQYVVPQIRHFEETQDILAIACAEINEYEDSLLGRSPRPTPSSSQVQVQQMPKDPLQDLDNLEVLPINTKDVNDSFCINSPGSLMNFNPAELADKEFMAEFDQYLRPAKCPRLQENQSPFENAQFANTHLPMPGYQYGVKQFMPRAHNVGCHGGWGAPHMQVAFSPFPGQAWSMPPFPDFDPMFMQQQSTQFLMAPR